MRLRGGFDDEEMGERPLRLRGGIGDDFDMREAPSRRVGMKKRVSSSSQRQLQNANSASSKPRGRVNRQMLKPPNFSIGKTGNTYVLKAVRLTDGVISQIKSFLRSRKGKVRVDGQPMSKAAAVRYITKTLTQRQVTVTFR